ncbi:hypothetical protein [Hellea balneolensis]|uniref:hypothetical protein n=1 Tax=Hellea balneolensis TaxID=287478 RepID=UPI00047D68E6|nr:hypothetical protein [Hellea balneolensis]
MNLDLILEPSLQTRRECCAYIKIIHNDLRVSERWRGFITLIQDILNLEAKGALTAAEIRSPSNTMPNKAGR